VEGVITGWRNEFYPVVQSFHEDPVFLVERAAAAHFGIKAYGEPPQKMSVCNILFLMYSLQQREQAFRGGGEVR
jgi:hypothetical protein